MKIVIIEDELPTAKDLERTILSVEPGVELLAILSSVAEAVPFLQQGPPIDLIFSDIELGDGLCFDIFAQVNNTAPIIFCTAYQQYALEAFKTTGIDYLLKPFSRHTVEQALRKFGVLKQNFSSAEKGYPALLAQLRQNLFPSDPAVVVVQGEKIIPVNGSDIALLYIDGNYTRVLTFDRKTYLVSQTLETLEATFGSRFFRANRQYLVNRRAVKDASLHFHRKLLINLSIPFPEQVIVGKLKTREFLDWLAANNS